MTPTRASIALTNKEMIKAVKLTRIAFFAPKFLVNKSPAKKPTQLRVTPAS